jgi:hypothetical protein
VASRETGEEAVLCSSAREEESAAGSRRWRRRRAGSAVLPRGGSPEGLGSAADGSTAGSSGGALESEVCENEGVGKKGTIASLYTEKVSGPETVRPALFRPVGHHVSQEYTSCARMPHSGRKDPVRPQGSGVEH